MKKPLLLALTGISALTMGNFASIPAIASSAPNAQVIPSLAPMLQSVMPAVVNITVRAESPAIDDPYNDSRISDNNSGQNLMPRFEGLGSGVIVDAKQGYILTNAHLIRKAKDITVKLSNGRSMKAKLIGSDPLSDIAVIQIPADKIMSLPLADSDNLKVGDFVAAIGNPFGLNQTVTSGIISALQRTDLHIEGGNGYENFIQTDAAINMGNSGGALVNMQGQLIGINTAILAPSGGSVGIGFAIPANMAKSVMAQLIKYGAVRRGLMGILAQSMTPELAAAFHTSIEDGAIVTLVTPESPAEKAGFKVGDIIQKINDIKIKDSFQVRNAIGLLRAGDPVSVTISRDGKPLKIDLTTADPKTYQQQMEAAAPFLFGLAMRDFDQQTPSGKHIKGVEVVHVTPNTAAFQGGLGLRPGDIILSANQIPINNLTELRDAVQKDKQQLVLNVLRQGGALFIVIK